VIGKIYDESSGSYLQKGSKVDNSAKLKFETVNARAAALSSSRGRFVIQKSSSTSSQSDLAYTLASVISPARGKLSTRAGGINNKLDFEKQFGEGPIAIIGGVYRVSVSSSAYPVSEDQFFYAQYEYQGESINKKLSNDGNELIFQVDELFKVDNQPINPLESSNMKLFYYDAQKQESTLLSPVEFVVVSEQDLQSIGNESNGDIEMVLEVVTSLYGKCDEKQLREALGN
jgi:hypothetical protein